MGRGILFVRSGGGMPGLDIHCGIWLALEEAGIRSDCNSGTSAGAAVAALDSCGWGAEGLRDLLTTLTDDMVRDQRALWKFRIPWITSLDTGERLRQMLDDVIPHDFAQLRKPLHVWATAVKDWRKVDVARPQTSASVARAVRASMAVPTVFPPVLLSDGVQYMDGGLRYNLPLPADWREYDQVYLLIASGRYDDRAGGGLITEGLRAINCLMADQVLDVIEQAASEPNVVAIWPAVERTRGMLHFDHELIHKSYLAAREILSHSARLRDLSKSGAQR